VNVHVRALVMPEEILDYHRLRYAAYDAIGYLRHHNAARLEIDEYDARAVPFAAFSATSGRLVGTLRLVTTGPQERHRKVLAAILERFPEADVGQLDARPEWPLPSIVGAHTARMLDRYNPLGLPVEELSRTIIHPDWQGAGISRAIIELAIAFAMRRGPRVLIGGCLAEHAPMYARYGFTPLPGTGIETFASVGQLAYTLAARTTALPEPTSAHVGAILAAARRGEKCSMDGFELVLD
jgi:GNAT superfamily N-acetyltransferase